MTYQAIALDSHQTDSRGFDHPITHTTNWKEDSCPDIDTSSFSNYIQPHYELLEAGKLISMSGDDRLLTAPAQLQKWHSELHKTATHSFIISTIEELSNLSEKACVDTADVRATLKQAVVDAIKFIAKLKVTNKPLISASEDGDVVLQWHTDGAGGAIVEFEGDGHFGYALLKYDRYVPGEYEGRLTDDLPPDLDTAISQAND